jgi:LacI family transcriptional regulator
MLRQAEPEHERRTIRQVMYSGLIDGVIIASMLVNDPLLHALLGGALPFVLIGRHPSRSEVSYVDVDNFEAAREAVNLLLRRGRRRIATITGPQNMVVGVDRLDGYQAALRGRGLVPEPDLCVEGDFTEAGGYAAMQRLLPAQPDAVFAASDVMALGALRALREAGRRVPDQVALVGFDDMPFAARTDPPLTTVRQPVHRTGQVAVETLIDLIEQRDTGPHRVVLPTQLVIRESSGEPSPTQ